MAGDLEEDPGQRPNENAEVPRGLSNEHFRKQFVPLAALVLFGVLDRYIPKGLPSTLEAIAIGAYMLEWGRQGLLYVGDLKRANETTALGLDNAPPIQSS